MSEENTAANQPEDLTGVIPQEEEPFPVSTEEDDSVNDSNMSGDAFTPPEITEDAGIELEGDYREAGG